MSFLITLTFISKEKKCIFLRNQNALKNFIAIAVQLHPALCDPWTAAPQTSFSFTKSRSLLKLMSIELVMPSNHFILCHPLFLPSIFPSIRVFSKSWLFTSGGQSIGASASVLPMNIQSWFPLGLSSLISLLWKGFSRLSTNTTAQKHQFFSAQLSLWSNSHIHTGPLEKL